ncbi:MAG: hypothetical protein ABIN96_06040 [Rubrivivax sp.]
MSASAPSTATPATAGLGASCAYHRLAATVMAPLRLRMLAAEATSRLQALTMPADATAVRELLDPILIGMQAALAPVALVSETWLGVGVLGGRVEGGLNEPPRCFNSRGSQGSMRRPPIRIRHRGPSPAPSHNSK